MKRWLSNAIAGVLGLAIGLVLLEVGVRVAGFTPPFTEANRRIGHRYIPSARYRHTGEEGVSSGKFNSAGWRDVEHSETKPEGVTRILLMGDSYVAAFQVPLDSTVARRLERSLNANARDGQRFEVIALGQDGNGSAAEYLSYLEWGRRYDPDVVAPLFVQNDPADNWKPLALDPQRPFFFESGDSLGLDSTFADTPSFRAWSRPNVLRTRSALWSALRETIARRRYAPRRAGAEGQPEDGYYRSWNFDARVSADTIAAFRLTSKILARFAREVAADGHRFVVFVCGFAQQEDQRLLEEHRRSPAFDEDKTARWLQTVGARERFEVVPLSPEFRRASAEAGGKPLWFGRDSLFGHWNSAGHAVAAAAMREALERSLASGDSALVSADSALASGSRR